MKPYVLINKEVGETPLQSAEKLRQQYSLSDNVPLAYAGRLDPMASGQLLVLIGNECKRQSNYHSLDKEYKFSVLFGIKSDTGDVLGLVETTPVLPVTKHQLNTVAKNLIGEVELPYPHFSSKTVQGKPLHVWTLEGRINEIEIPTKLSSIYKLHCENIETIYTADLLKNVRAKIETIPPVTDPRKALGNDFRRPDVREAWTQIENTTTETSYTIAHFTCIASSGTYMRTLAEVIGRECGQGGLAYSIHRTIIGKYQPLPLVGGIWKKRF